MPEPDEHAARPIRPDTADDDSCKSKVVDLPLPMTSLRRPKLVVLAMPRTSRSRNAIPLCVNRWRDSQIKLLNGKRVATKSNLDIQTCTFFEGGGGGGTNGRIAFDFAP